VQNGFFRLLVCFYDFQIMGNIGKVQQKGAKGTSSLITFWYSSGVFPFSDYIQQKELAFYTSSFMVLDRIAFFRKGRTASNGCLLT
jgi:hypothetical protein